MSRVTQFIGAYQCDHGVCLVRNCGACNRLHFWRMIRTALALAIPAWCAIGLLAIWWLR